MGKQNCTANSEWPFHITARVHNRDHYPLPLEETWGLMLENLTLTHHLYNLRIHSLVLMPNHFHMMASTPDANLGSGMQYFLSQLTRQVNNQAKIINQLHGARYHKTVIASYHYLSHAYKYVYQNPMKAVLCNSVESYPFSTLRMRLGLSAMELPLEPDDLLMDDIEGTLKWLNTAAKERDWTSVRRAMREAKFTLFPTSSSRRKSRLETERL